MHFTEVEEIFKKNLIWKESYEMCWYKMAWEALRKEGLLKENSLFEFYIVELRAFALIMLYSEFCQIQYEEVCFYEFNHALEYPDVTDFNLALIAGVLLDSEVLKECIEEEDINQLLVEVIETMREEVFDALVKNIGEGSESTLYASMVATNWKGIDLENEYDMDDEIESELIESGSPDDVCEKYKQIIYTYAEDILNADDYNSAEAFEWISSGTYRLEEY